jgi:beta-glucanase (GH16 family)
MFDDLVNKNPKARSQSKVAMSATIVLCLLSLVNLAFGFSWAGRSTPSTSNPPTMNVSDPTVWSLVWRDEFNGPNGSGIDPTKWVSETGGWGWGNNELEYYTSRPVNAHLENGALVITALRETYTGPDNVTRDYTSARLKTQGKFSLTYGRIEARLKIPYGQGLWPAFWMLGADIDQVSWPTCGEMDIMENIGREPSMVHGTIHGPGYSGGNGIGASYSLPNGRRFADDFHTFAIEWEPNVIRFYVDGLLYATKTPTDLPNGSNWVFAHPFFILLNVAVGGFWPGNPDASTVFPQTMKVDYVRVYQRTTPSNATLLLTEDSSNRALALDSVTHVADPFPVVGLHNFSQDQRTRVTLLAANFDLRPGDTTAIVTAQAQDSSSNTYPLTVEYVGRVPEFDWITQVIVRLPDGLVSPSDLLVRINARGSLSNQALISIK